MSEPRKVEVDLTATERAYVSMVIEEHTALVKSADARRESRLSVLLKEKGVPDGIAADIDTTNEPATLSYRLP